MPASRIILGDAAEVLAELPSGIAQTCVTSPPYYGLRDYGHPGQIGQEDSLPAYVERLVQVLEGVRRVLRDDGTLWLNLGDSYATRWSSVRSGGGAGFQGGERARTGIPSGGLKDKDLMMMPARVALALQDAGWYLRKDVIWEKPNPMPESTRDRPTSSHEHLFLLAKSERYYYDLDGFREPAVSGHASGNGYRRDARQSYRDEGGARGSEQQWTPSDTRQLRDVWRIPTTPFPGAHFAVFPVEMPRRCVLLGTSPFACPACGAPYRRVVQVDGVASQDLLAERGESPYAGQPEGRHAQSLDFAGNHGDRALRTRRTVGWRPTCACGAPADVLPDDLEEIASPALRGQAQDDPSAVIGRAGLGRERADGEGVHPQTRFEQRAYARALQQVRRAQPIAWRALCEEHGVDTMAHYARTDVAGARAIPRDVLERWQRVGLLKPVAAPAPWWRTADAGRGLVLDPFAGAGTTGLAAAREGRDFLGIELSEDYAALARDRLAPVAAQESLALDGAV